MTQWLYRAMSKAGISDSERRQRVLTFHSWRKFWNTYLRGRGYVPDALVRATVGHATEAMTERYTGFQAADFGPVIRAQLELAESLAASATPSCPSATTPTSA